MHLVNEDLQRELLPDRRAPDRFAATTKEVRTSQVGSSGPSSPRTGSRRSSAPRSHDGHAFTLEDNILTGNCFGCQEGGDVIAFLMKIDGLTFGETVERLADKYGVQLRREDGDGPPERPRGPARGRLIEANKIAQEFYAGQLETPDAQDRARVPDPARLRPGSRRDLRARLRAARRRSARQAPEIPRASTDEEGIAGRAGGERPLGLRPLPRPPAVADPRRERRHDRLRCPPDLRRRQDRGEVPQHLRDDDLQEEPGALRHRPRPPRHGALVAGGRRRGLHRRDGLPPVRRPDRGRHLRHRLRRRPRARAAPASCTTTRSSAAR